MNAPKSIHYWNRKGLWVKKGSKAVAFNSKGLPLFSEEQTEDKRKSNYGPMSYDEDEHWGPYPCYMGL